MLDLQFWNVSSSLPENYRANGENYDKFVFSTTDICMCWWCLQTFTLVLTIIMFFESLVVSRHINTLMAPLVFFFLLINDITLNIKA